jgi:putative ABC transport system permease protein
MPEWKQEIRERLANLRLEPSREAAIIEELTQHLEDYYEELLAGGATVTEAERLTQAEFSEHDILTRELRRVERQILAEPIILGHNRRSHMIADLWQDLRFGARMFLAKPGFTLIVVLTLALGIGANTTIFSVINSLLFKPIPFADPSRLVMVWQNQINRPDAWNIVSAPNYLDWQKQNTVFSDMALFDSAGKGYNLSGDGEPEQVSGVRVSPSFFDVLGVKPRLGRTFLAEEEMPGKHQVVVLSDGLWRSRYAADSTLVGKPILLDGESYTVIGIMPPDFEFQFASSPRKLWVPIVYTEGDKERGSNSFYCLARLKPGVTIEQAKAEMDAIGRGLAEQYPESNNGNSATAVPIGDFGMENQRSTLFTLLAVAGFVLLIACVNVANLLMARGATRQREFAIRSALGASRARTIRQLMTESLLLAIAGGISGTLLAVWVSNLLLTVLPNNLRVVPFRSLTGITIDYKVLAFTWGVTCLTGILFGLAPAIIYSKRNVSESLQEGSRGSSGKTARLRQSLVILEVALALIVLTGAGLMIESMKRLINVDPGFNPHNLLTMDISLPQENLYYSPPLHPQFAHELQQQVGSIPGVLSVSAVSHPPINGGMASRGFVIEGRPDPGRDNAPGAKYTLICPNYFQTMGIRLISGREFTEEDGEKAPGVIVINEAMAKRYWQDEDPLGKRIKIGRFDTDAPWLTIVGIAQDVRQGGLDRQPRAEFFRPYNQAAWPFMTIVVRTAGDTAAFIKPVKEAMLRVEPSRAVSGIGTMDEVIYNSLGARRFPMLLLMGFSFVALALAAVGIAGVVSFSVSQRTREIGIRMALGARKGDVVRLVLNRHMGAAVVGIGLGLLGSYALTKFLAELLFEVKPMDAGVLASVTIVLVSVAFLACYLPARRATKVDPMTALRCE